MATIKRRWFGLVLSVTVAASLIGIVLAARRTLIASSDNFPEVTETPNV